MTSTLAQQLQKVSLALGKVPGHLSDTHSSLLYSASEAADTDLRSVYDTAVLGLQQLAKRDPRFTAYKNSLFNLRSLSLDIGQLTKAELKAVKMSISAYLHLVSPHFLNNACTKTLEYLVRKYKVHLIDAEELIAVFLPFHATNQFVRLIQISEIENTVWSFLQPMKKSGASLPRNSLVQRCTTDKALLKLICERGRSAGIEEQLDRVAVSFYAVTVCEILAACIKVDEVLVRLLMPYLLSGVGNEVTGPKISAEYRAATYLIFMQLCRSTPLATEFLKVVMQQILKNAPQGEQEQALAVLNHTVAVQVQLTKLPKSVVKAAANRENMAPSLKKLVERGAKSQRFLQLLVSGLCCNLQNSKYCKLLNELADHVPLGNASASACSAVLLLGSTPDSVQIVQLQQLFRSLELRYPEEADNAINSILKLAGSDHEAAIRVSTFVTASVAKTPRAVLEGTPVTIAAAIDSQAAQLRVQAVKQLGDLLGEERECDFVRGAIVRRLGDEDTSVLVAVLSSPALRQIPASQAAQLLSALLQRTQRQILEEALPGSELTHQDIMKLALTALADAACESTAHLVAGELLSFMLNGPKTAPISGYARGVASQMHYPIFSVKTGQKGAGLKPTVDDKAEKHAANLVVIEQLAQGIQSTTAEEVAAVANHARGPGRLLLLLALLQACLQGSEAAARSVLRIVQTDWTALDTTADANVYMNTNPCTSGGKVDNLYLDAQAFQNQGALTALLQHCLLAALKSLPTVDRKESIAIFKALCHRQPEATFKPHLQALVGCLEESAAEFLSNVFALPSARVSLKEQVMSLEMFGEARGANKSKFLELGLICRLIAAMTHPAATARVAAVAAATSLLQNSKEVTEGQAGVRELLTGIANHSKDIAADGGAITTLTAKLLSLSSSSAPGSWGGKKSPAKRKNTKQVPLQHVLEILETCEGPCGVVVAKTLLAALRPIVPSLQLLLAAWPVAERLLQHASHLEEEKMDTLQDILELFTAAAVVEASHDDQTVPVKQLAQLIFKFSESGDEASLVVAPNVKIAAINRVSNDLFSALSLYGKLLIFKGLLGAACNDGAHAVRSAAQQALRGLSLDAGLVAAFLPPRDMHPPTPAPKRARHSKAADTRTEDLSQQNFSLSEDELQVLATGALEALGYITNVKGSELLLRPLSTCLKFLLEQLKNDVESSEAVLVDENVARWQMSAEYLMQLTLNAMLQLTILHSDEPCLKVIDLEAVIECTGFLSASARSVGLKLLINLARAQGNQLTEVADQILAALASSVQADQQLVPVAVDTLQALVPVWLSAGHKPPVIAAKIVGNLHELPIHLLLPMLTVVVSALPEASGLQEIVGLLLTCRSEMTSIGMSSEDTETAALLKGGEFVLELASMLTRQMPRHVRMKAFSSLMKEAMEACNGDPESNLLLITTGFVATELAAPSGEPANPDDSQLGLRGVLEVGLLQMQAIGQGLSADPSPKLKATARATDHVLEALQASSQPGSFTQCLLELLRSASEPIQRKIFKLLRSSAGREESKPAADAAVAFCQTVQALLAGPASAATKQAALEALASLAAAHGKACPKEFLTVLPVVLSLVSDPAWPLRAAALQVTSAIVRALALAALPALNQLAPALLSAIHERIAASPAPSSQLCGSMAVGGAGRSRLGGQADMQAALSALEAMMENFGPFMSPYLAESLQVLLHKKLLSQCNAGGSPSLSVRTTMATTIPARLLLPALAAHFDHAFQEGPEALQELLKLTTTVVDKLKTRDAASNANMLWTFLLKVLDFRRQQPSQNQHFYVLEDAALLLMTTLTLKINEAKFKPLFLELVDWAAGRELPGGVGAAPRQVALFKAVNALAEQLRGVFVPYFRYLLDLAVMHLGRGGNAPGKAKKRRKTEAPEHPASQASELLKLQVVRALHSCFLYDCEGFLDDATFNRLLQPLTSQLRAELPEEVAANELLENLKTAGIGEGLDAMGQAVVDALAQMAVAAGTEALWKPLHHQVDNQPGSCARPAAAWKAHGHSRPAVQVLMASRSKSLIERSRALQVIVQLVEKLGEEYVLLLPEAMPFFAELLEDSELSIQNRTRAVLKTLEELTGENLDEHLKI